MDANEYALKVTPASQSLRILIESAQWLGKGRRASAGIDASHESKEHTVSSNSGLAANVSCSDEGKATKEKKVEAVASNASVGAKPLNGVKLAQLGDDLHLELGERQWRVRGLLKNSNVETLKVNLRLWCRERYYLDTLDLTRARDRAHYVAAAAAETTLEPDLIKRDLGKLLLALEQYQEARLREALEPARDAVPMSDADKRAALELLRSPHLLERILEDFDRCGIVGERVNKLTGYLAAVSRKLDRPLAIIVQSTSAAGKTALMEAVLALMPPEECVKYSAMTGQSLYYLGETDLKHKILAIVEEEGAEKASYALKLLQSEGELTIASTGKDESGRMKTEEYHVEGPVMIFLTTTAIDIDEELLNRCLVLSVDESREQTRAIHRLQREAETFEGLRRKVERERVLAVHRSAQRLLRAVHVVNPFASRLTFLCDRTRTRRDHVKYLTLIRTIALLHQHQRPLREKDGLQYIEVVPADIEAANQIAHEVLGRSLDELPPQTRRLLLMLREMVSSLCAAKALEPSDCLFSRREVRRFTGWSEYQVRVHLNKLQEMEYLLPHYGGRGQSFVYELLFDGDGQSDKPQLNGLIDTATLRASSIETGPSSPQRASNEAPSGSPAHEAQPSQPAASRLNGAKNPEIAPGPRVLTPVVS
jgi:hypothetical protein